MRDYVTAIPTTLITAPIPVVRLVDVAGLNFLAGQQAEVIVELKSFWLTANERRRLHRVVGRIRRRPAPPDVQTGGAE